jgi:1-acyl-sn-glycerol-3-phosphate acyltransferase
MVGEAAGVGTRSPGRWLGGGSFGWLRRRHHGSTVPQLLLYEFVRAAAMLAYMLVYRLRVFNARGVPPQGALLIVANHTSYLDPQIMAAAIGNRQIDFIAKMELFRPSRAFGWFVESLHATPINDEGGSDMPAIKEVLRRLDRGCAVLIFPEGGRGKTGLLEPFKRGVALLVKRSGCPVIPAAIEGCLDAWPPGQTLPSLVGKRVAVMFGEPIPHDELLQGGADAALARLRGEVDRMRLELRAKLRAATKGRFPPRGAADGPSPN